MFNVFTAFIVMLFLSACGSSTKPKGELLSIPLELQVSEKINEIRKWAPTCLYAPEFRGVSKDTCEAEGTGSGDGDVMAYAGYLCFVGEEIGCETVRRSQDSNGRLWRSPARVGNPQNYTDTFSRDMLLGYLFYLVGSKDIESALSFQAYLETTGYLMCPDSVDNRCSITPNMYGLMGEVWNYLGLPLTIKMKAAGLVDDVTLRASALSVPLGYQAELLAMQILLRQELGTYTTNLEVAINTLHDRDPKNPLFLFIAKGKSDEVLQIMLEQMPTQVPGSKYVWTIAQEVASNQFGRSMGWEWIFMGRLLKIQ